MALATWMSERLDDSTSTMGNCVVRIGSGSSSSKEVRHRRHKLLTVLNWTRWQWSHLTTSRESTGARVVAMRVADVPERAQQQLTGTLRYSSGRVKYIVG